MTTELNAEMAVKHAAMEVPIAAPGDRVADVRKALSGRRFDTVAAVAVTELGRLVGLIRVEDLFAAPAEDRVSDVMDRDPPVVRSDMDQERVAWQAVHHGEATMAVVDDEGAFIGLIPPPRLLAVVMWEHEEDLARLGGFQHNAEAAREASTASIPRRFRQRLPWLLLGLLGALAAAALVASFEEALQRNVLLAIFVPGIVYMADAVGTQTETLLIRGLSLGVPIRQVAIREFFTGILVGATVAAAFYPLAVLLWGDSRVALAAALSLFAACATATLVAMILPYLFTRFGRDPAYGSGPLGTVVQDLLSIVIYFDVASALGA